MMSTSFRHLLRLATCSRWNTGDLSAIGNSVMNTAPQVFDRAVYLDRQSRASGDAMGLLDARVTEELLDRLLLINRNFEQALIIAPRAEEFAARTQATGKFAALTAQPPSASDDLKLTPSSFNAIISLLDLHTVNDVPGYMAQVANALQPDGLAMFAFFAGESLRELREAWLVAEQQVTGGASPRVAPMIDLRETGGLLQRAGLALPVADVDRATLRYPDAMSLMREIKALGFSNCLTGRVRHLTTPGLLFQAATTYPSDTDGRISVTLEIAWATAWKPHQSQQQPLKPGSAKARLADALKVGEVKL
jgi:SAM-dependent methyltransferase